MSGGPLVMQGGGRRRRAPRSRREFALPSFASPRESTTPAAGESPRIDAIASSNRLPNEEACNAVRLGALFPQTDLPVADVKRFAQGVEELGFSHVLVYDHVLGADPEAHPEYPGPWSFTMDDALHEPLVLCGYLAAAAPSLELATGIVIAPQRQTALLAKQAVQVDLPTGGRFPPGVGQGGNPVGNDAP